MAVGAAWCDYELRRNSIGQFVLFFTIVDETRAVWVVHPRRGKQLTEPDAFPTDLAAVEQDDDYLES